MRHVRGENHPQYRHGMSRTPENNCWRSMRQRCTDPHVASYKNYGGRGIKMCERWQESFENFYADVGPRPSPNYSIDRYPNKDGDYEPGNVRWATASEQQNNLRSNRIVHYRDREMTFTQASRLAGSVVTVDTALKRVYKGWSVKDAVEIPVGVRTRWSA
jgi:hypothetical protein